MSLDLLQTLLVTATQRSTTTYGHFPTAAPFLPLSSSTQSATSDSEKADLFNTFFHSVYKPSLSNPSLPPSSEPTLTYPNITNISFTELDVFSALSSLDPAKSMGVDCIGSKLLKHCALALYIPLHHLFSLSISKHSIPSEWKHHSITPIYKSGEKSLVSNYRPVSLLCITSKVLERLIYDNLSKFVLFHGIISPSQFGFLKYRSTTQQLLVFLDNVHRILNSNDACDVIGASLSEPHTSGTSLRRCVCIRPTDRPTDRPYTVNFKCAFKYFSKIELPRSPAWKCAGLLSECSVAAVGNRSGDGSRV